MAPASGDVDGSTGAQSSRFIADLTSAWAVFEAAQAQDAGVVVDF
jgi:hypothetical protein